MKKLALVSSAVLGAMVIGAQSVNADTQVDSNHVRVEQGDTVSEIAHKHNVSVDSLVQANHLSNPDMIFVGDTLVLTPNASDNKNTTQTQSDTGSQHMGQHVHMIENNNQPATIQQSATNNNVNLSGNSMAALRRSIESGGNYNTNTGNGYLGAYQFAPQTIAGIESATGMKWSMDPATQDAFANYYANTRYGGWAHVPTTGGW